MASALPACPSTFLSGGWLDGSGKNSTNGTGSEYAGYFMNFEGKVGINGLDLFVTYTMDRGA